MGAGSLGKGTVTSAGEMSSRGEFSLGGSIMMCSEWAAEAALLQPPYPLIRLHVFN